MVDLSKEPRLWAQALHYPLVASRARVRDFADYAVVRVVLKTLERLPMSAARAVAGGLARLARLVTPRWRQVAYRNLEIALPASDAATRRRIVDGVYENLARILLSLSRMPRLDPRNIHDWIGYEGYDYFEQALSGGQGVLFMTAHLGNWELSAQAHALLGNPMHVMVRSFDNPLLDRLIDDYRTLHGNRTILKQDFGRTLLRALKDNEAVGVLVDQNVIGEDTAFVDFFGVKAAATSGFVKIAMRTGAAVIPGFALWNPEQGRYVLKFYPPLEMAETGDPEQDLVTNTQRCQSKIEEVIREYPDQWLWIHKRWKHRPPGEPELYP